MSTFSFPSTYKVSCHTKYIGKNSTFVCIKGMNEDGLHYVPEALGRGAAKIVIDEKASITTELNGIIKAYGAELIIVPNARKALAELSAKAYNFPAQALKIIGITGTKGKSTTAFLTEHTLKTAGFKTALLSTIKNRILEYELPCNLTTPQPDYLHAFFDSCVAQGVEFVIMEVAAQALTLHRLDTLQFDRALFTNFSLEHSEFYKTLDEYFQAKVQLFDRVTPTGTMIFNSDDEKISDLATQFPLALTFGIQKKATLQSNVSDTIFHIQTNFSYKGTTYSVRAPQLLGNFNVYNCLAAASIAHSYDIDHTLIQRAFETFKGTPGRLERYYLANGAMGCVDYAHNPSSYQAILSTLRSLTNHLIVVFGAGGNRDPIKRPIMGTIASELADIVILTSDNPRFEEPEAIIAQIKAGVTAENMHKLYCEVDRERAIKKAYTLSKDHSIIVVLGKGPDEYQLIKGIKYPFSDAGLLRSFQNHEIIK